MTSSPDRRRVFGLCVRPDAGARSEALQIIASAKAFGWDGVRWDGHFVGNMARCKERLNAALPNFVHGYNIAFANPGAPYQ